MNMSVRKLMVVGCAMVLALGLGAGALYETTEQTKADLEGIRSGETKLVTVSSGEQAAYSFYGTEGQGVAIAVGEDERLSGYFDPRVVLSRPDGFVASSDGPQDRLIIVKAGEGGNSGQEQTKREEQT